jgi:hypothetical protein
MDLLLFFLFFHLMMLCQLLTHGCYECRVGIKEETAVFCFIVLSQNFHEVLRKSHEELQLEWRLLPPRFEPEYHVKGQYTMLLKSVSYESGVGSEVLTVVTRNFLECEVV